MMVERSQKDLQLWDNWKKSGKPKDFNILMQNFEPLIRTKMNPYLQAGLRLPPAAIETEFRKQFYNAVESYNPKKKVKLGTWVFSNLDAGKRFVTMHQNIARIPESRIYKIKTVQMAREKLMERTGQLPTSKELAGFTGYKVKDIVKLSKELRRDFVRSKFTKDPSSIVGSVPEAKLKLFRYELNDQEQTVFDQLLQGKKPGMIAKGMELTPQKISRIKRGIVKRWLEHK